MKPLRRARAERLLEKMRRQRVAVVGDVMLDEFLWGRVARISPEAPVPVVEVASQTFHLGGAANVASNVRSLGGRSAVAGVIGRDTAGEFAHLPARRDARHMRAMTITISRQLRWYRERCRIWIRVLVHVLLEEAVDAL